MYKHFFSHAHDGFQYVPGPLFCTCCLFNVLPCTSLVFWERPQSYDVSRLEWIQPELGHQQSNFQAFSTHLRYALFRVCLIHDYRWHFKQYVVMVLSWVVDTTNSVELCHKDDLITGLLSAMAALIRIIFSGFAVSGAYVRNTALHCHVC